jgi:hypothetical protein
MKKNYTIVFAVIAALIALCAFWGCASGGDDDDSGSAGPIGSAADLAKIGTPGYPLDGTYELTADITLPAGWTPIGSGTAPFTGTFDGKGHSITVNSTTASSIAIKSFSSGVDISSAPVFVSSWDNVSSYIARGLFAYTENATIKDLNITISPGSSFVITFTATDQLQLFGTVAAAAVNTAFTNINISGGMLEVDASSTDKLMLGSIAGIMLEGSSITGCSMTGNVEVSISGDEGETDIGGLVGYARGFIVNSFVNGDVEVSGGSEHQIGGLAGALASFDGGGGRIENCYVTGNVSAESSAAGGSGGHDAIKAGGLVGQLDEDTRLVVIKKSYSTGKVSGKSYSATGRTRAGGIAAAASEYVEISDCYSTEDVSAEGTGEVYAGGILGDTAASNTNNNTIKRCYVLGDISAAGSGYKRVGGIAGNVKTGSGSITGCAVLSGTVSYNTGSGTAKRIVGSTGSISLDNNIARNPMSGGSWTVNADGQDGADVSVPASQSDFEITLEWDFSSVWKWQGGYPVLQWQ